MSKDNSLSNTGTQDTRSGRERSIAAGTANLIPLSERTKAEQRAIQSMGGKADGARRRKRKTFREAFEAVLSLPATVQEDNEIVNAAIEACPELTQQEAIAIAIVGKAARGSIDAAAFVRDTIGERPIDKQEVSTSGGVDVTITVVRDEHRN